MSRGISSMKRGPWQRPYGWAAALGVRVRSVFWRRDSSVREKALCRDLAQSLQGRGEGLCDQTPACRLPRQLPCPCRSERSEQKKGFLQAKWSHVLGLLAETSLGTFASPVPAPLQIRFPPDAHLEAAGDGWLQWSSGTSPALAVGGSCHLCCSNIKLPKMSHFFKKKPNVSN